MRSSFVYSVVVSSLFFSAAAAVAAAPVVAAAAAACFFFKISAKVLPPPQDGATGVMAGWLSMDSGLDETLDLSSALESSVRVVDFDSFDEWPFPPVDGGNFNAFPSSPAAALAVVVFYKKEELEEIVTAKIEQPQKIVRKISGQYVPNPTLLPVAWFVQTVRISYGTHNIKRLCAC